PPAASLHLLPYTPLFRSLLEIQRRQEHPRRAEGDEGGDRRPRGEPGEFHRFDDFWALGDELGEFHPQVPQHLPVLTGPQLYLRGDRKSTRLNSSHVSISY